MSPASSILQVLKPVLIWACIISICLCMQCSRNNPTPSKFNPQASQSTLLHNGHVFQTNLLEKSIEQNIKDCLNDYFQTKADSPYDQYCESFCLRLSRSCVGPCFFYKACFLFIFSNIKMYFKMHLIENNFFNSYFLVISKLTTSGE